MAEAKKHPKIAYILAFDNDPDKTDDNGKKKNPGKDAQKRLAAEMEAAGLLALNFDPKELYGDAKDANEAYVKDEKALKERVSFFQALAINAKYEREREQEEELKK